MEPEFVIENGVLTKYNGPGGDVIVPEGVEKIEHSVFDNCVKLTGVTLPESLLAIEFHAFMDCRNLAEITIPKNVRKIGPWAFFYCTSLKRITVLSPKVSPPVKGEDPFEDVDAPIVAPNMPLGDMSALWKLRAVWGFAREQTSYPDERQREYLKYIKSQRKRLYPLAVRVKALLMLMLGEGMVSDTQPLLDEAERQNNTEAKALIQAYQP